MLHTHNTFFIIHGKPVLSILFPLAHSASFRMFLQSHLFLCMFLHYVLFVFSTFSSISRCFSNVFHFLIPIFCMIKYAVFFSHVFPRKKSRNGFYSPFRDFSSPHKYALPVTSHTGQFLLCCLCCIHEVLHAEYSCIDTGYIRLLHVYIVVVVERNNRPCTHQHILCIMH